MCFRSSEPTYVDCSLPADDLLGEWSQCAHVLEEKRERSSFIRGETKKSLYFVPARKHCSTNILVKQ